MNKVKDETAKLDRKVGARLRYARKARGLSQATLGGAIGVSFQQVQKYELGVNRISSAAVIQFARILEISPLELLGNGERADQAYEETLVGAEGAAALLQAYKAIGSPKLRRVVCELARSLAEGEGGS